VFLGLRKRVEIEMVDSEEVTRRKVNIGFAGEFTSLLCSPERRSEKENISVLVYEFNQFLRGESRTVACIFSKFSIIARNSSLHRFRPFDFGGKRITWS